MDYGAYFCSTHKRDALEYHVKLIDLQRFLFPLVNITIEKNQDGHALSPLGFSPRIRGPRSFAQVMDLEDSEDSVLGEYLKSLDNKFDRGVIPAPTETSQELTENNLKELQCSLAHCRSPKDIHHPKAAVPSSCGFLVRHQKSEELVLDDAQSDLPPLTSRATITDVSIDFLLSNLSISLSSKNESTKNWAPEIRSLWMKNVDFGEKSDAWCDRDIWLTEEVDVYGKPLKEHTVPGSLRDYVQQGRSMRRLAGVEQRLQGDRQRLKRYMRSFVGTEAY